MNNNGYQPAEQRTVVMAPYNRLKVPSYLQQGVRIGGLAISLSSVAFLGMLGVFSLLFSIVMLATANYDDDFWEDFDKDVDPRVIFGSIFFVLGIIMVGLAVGVCFYAHKKYKSFDGQGLTSPGRVINPNPGGYPEQPQTVGRPGYPQQAGYGQPQPTGYPGQPQPTGYPGQPQPTGYPGQPQPTGYPGQPQPYGYPGQPQPYGYPGQPQATGFPEQPFVVPEQTAFLPGPPAPYPQQAGGYVAQPDPTYPEKPGKQTVTSVTNEYVPPPPTVPGTSHVPSAPSSEPPPYQP